MIVIVYLIAEFFEDFNNLNGTSCYFACGWDFSLFIGEKNSFSLDCYCFNSFIPLYQSRKYFRASVSDENIKGSELAIGSEILERHF